MVRPPSTPQVFHGAQVTAWTQAGGLCASDSPRILRASGGPFQLAGHATDPGRQLNQNCERALTHEWATAIQTELLRRHPHLMIRLSRSPGESLTNLQLVSFANRLGVDIVLLTLSGEGAVGSNEKGIWHVKPARVTVVNDVGSGDAFLAAFLGNFLKGKNFPDSLKAAVAFATAAAASSSTLGINHRDIDEIARRTKVGQL